ncbi:MAG: hypothetical protein GWP05_07995 [Anaerolineaceae bacterium]|nr:hypothetical protein [Anaerolineaceae bacterium]
MRRVIVGVMLLSCVSLATGCVSRAIKEGFGAARGAKGVATVSKPFVGGAAGGALGVFRRFVVEPFSDESPSPVPREVNARLPRYVARMLTDKKIPSTAGGRTLTIRGVFLYYEESGGATSQVFGPFEEVIAKVRFYDGRKLIGEAICVGRTTESVNMGPDKKAQGLAKAIVDLIDRHYPKGE